MVESQAPEVHVKTDELFKQIDGLVNELERADNEEQSELRTRIAAAQSEARAAASGDASTSLGEGNNADLQVAHQIDCLEQRLNTFESKLANANPEVQALIQAALEGALEGDVLDNLRQALQGLQTAADE
uniref:Uncharacterized protein n=1 Tax=Pyramimonas obovata TaxID=1411642 RepID=A0A7S0QXE6_9CHLO|mmetsp:Transcript_15841/g.34354  ORF Transcript_15841/g.34354 Transcript_15841/m.34354 type:complete len:130 (+) Transcript_15841:70-459(+)